MCLEKTWVWTIKHRSLCPSKLELCTWTLVKKNAPKNVGVWGRWKAVGVLPGELGSMLGWSFSLRL